MSPGASTASADMWARTQRCSDSEGGSDSAPEAEAGSDARGNQYEYDSALMIAKPGPAPVAKPKVETAPVPEVVVQSPSKSPSSSRVGVGVAEPQPEQKPKLSVLDMLEFIDRDISTRA